MNQYGRMALEHWRRWRPGHFAAVTAEESAAEFFTRLGEQVAREIGDLTARMAAEEGVRHSDHAVVAGRLAMVRNDAEQAVLRERVLLPAETDDEDLDVGGGQDDDEDGDDGAADDEFEIWKADTLAALAGERITPADLTRDELARLRAATRDPRLRELAGIRDEDLRGTGLI